MSGHYRGRESSFWRERHERFGDSILAVGRTNATAVVNEKEYHVAMGQFCDMVRRDIPDRKSSRVLDLGFGQAHYAKACHGLGFGSYVGLDFAAPIPSWSADRYEFHHGDIASSHAFGKFDLVYCIDVIFHVVDDLKFEETLRNMASSCRGFVYVTSLFRPFVVKPHVNHRPMESFSKILGEPLSVNDWRDNRIARFRPTIC